MLERQGLILTDWTPLAQLPVNVSRTPAPADHIRVRSVHDAGNRRFVGFATATRLFQQPLFSRPAFEVYETEDASLLFSLCRPWLFSWTWDVFDAEVRHVGIIHRAQVFDGAANHLGVMNLASAGDRGNFTIGNGVELANFELRELEMQLNFCPAVDGEPFVRMILLAALLALADRTRLRRRPAVEVQPVAGAQPC